MEGWSLALSIGKQDSTIFLPVDPLRTDYLWATPDAVFSVSGFSKGSTITISVWLIPDETSIGRLLCYTGSILLDRLHLVYPPQVTVDCFRSKPSRRKSLPFISIPPVKRYTTTLNTNTPDIISMSMEYTCRFSYKRSGSADLHAQLKVYGVRINMDSGGHYAECLRHVDGRRIVLMCDDKYVGGAQHIQERTNVERLHRTYVWETVAHKDTIPLTSVEKYDYSIIEGFNVNSPRTRTGATSHTSAVGTIMSPRVTQNNIKTPRPMSHLGKVELIPPIFIPDTVESHNATKRLYTLVNADKVTFKVFNFRFTPPRFVYHTVSREDFEAAYKRTKAKHQVAQINHAPTNASNAPKRKSFTPKKKKTSRKIRKAEAKRQEAVERDNKQMMCRLERPIAADILLVITFIRPHAERIYLGEVILEVNNYDAALQMERVN